MNLMADTSSEAETTNTEATSKTTTNASEGSWLDSYTDLPDDIKGDPSLKVFTDVPGLIKSYVNAQKLVGADKFVVPSKDAGDEAWKEVFQKLGVPENRDDYKVTPEEGVDDEYFKSFLDNAHAAGLLPSQAKKLADFQVKFATDQAKEISDKAELEMDRQIEEFRVAEGDKFNTTVRSAKLVIKQFDDADESFSALVESDPVIGNNPKLIKFLARVADSLTEDTFKATAISSIGTTAEEAQAKLNTIMGEKDGPYWNGSHPDHKRIVSEVNKLMNVSMQG